VPQYKRSSWFSHEIFPALSPMVLWRGITISYKPMIPYLGQRTRGGLHSALDGNECQDESQCWTISTFELNGQTLRRLPRSGGVLFTIRTYMLPVREMCKGEMDSLVDLQAPLEAGATMWRSSKDCEHTETLSNPYPAQYLTTKVLLPFLDKEHERQIRKA